MAQTDVDRRRKALKKYIDSNKLKILPWAKEAGVSEAAVRLFIKGRTESLNETTYRKLAKARGVTVGVLLGEEAAPKELPLWGYAGAGDVVHQFDGDELRPADLVEAPPGLEDGAAVMVRGDSMLPRLQDGDVIFFEMKEMPADRLLNEECVVRLADGKVFVKRLRRGTRKNRFHLVSINPAVPMIENQPVAWASAIQWIKRRVPARS